MTTLRSMIDDRSIGIHAYGIPNKPFRILYGSGLGIWFGGPGSGCNPEAGVCGPKSHGQTTKELDEAVSKKFERYAKMVKAVGDKKINGLAVFGEREESENPRQ